MNIISISGNVTKDAEVKFLGDGTAVCSFGIADNMIGKDKGAIFWNCSFFGKRGESVAPYIIKGQPVTVNGSISERSWNDKDGQQRKSMDVRVNDIALQGGKRDDSQRLATARNDSPRITPAPKAPAGGFDDFDDLIPF